MVVDLENGKLLTANTIKSWIVIGSAILAVIGWGFRLEWNSNDHGTRIAENKAAIQEINDKGTRAVTPLMDRLNNLDSRQIDLSTRVTKIEDLKIEIGEMKVKQDRVISDLRDLHHQWPGGERGPPPP